VREEINRPTPDAPYFTPATPHWYNPIPSDALPARLMAGQQPLNLFIVVRIHGGQPTFFEPEILVDPAMDSHLASVYSYYSGLSTRATE
jgi:hypothetical protein